MIYLKVFPEHTSYEAEVNRGVDFKIPNVSYCKNVDDVHFNPYNLIEFYVGEITTQQTVSIYTDETNHVDFQVSEGEGNKWYSYLLPKNKGLYRVEGDSVKKVVVKADINIDSDTIIPTSTVEASFKGSNTSNVTNMLMMFYGCEALTSLDLSGWDTSNVTNMGQMFGDCNSLTSLDLSSFDTSHVTDMYQMFSGCSGLKSLDLSGWDTNYVTRMMCMFAGCSSLESLDLRNFNTFNVTNMNEMFYGCSGLTSLDLSGWDTSNVTNMGSMFNNCSGLTSLDLSYWNMSNVTNMDYMFNGCGSLETIKMIGCSPETIQKITDVKPSGATIITGQTI